MPKNKGKRGGGNGGHRRGRNDNRTDLLQKVDMHNERFTTYYKAQNIVPDDEWDLFIDSLKTHLPTTFRVAGSRQTAQLLNATIKETYVPSLSDVVFEDQSVPPPVQIPWYPDGLAWQFNVPKKVLRKSPEFKKFHSFLVFETEVGNVSRQEAVSMLPPLFLEVEPHHRVMDMCAAPGSKTAQLLEALHAQDTATSTSIPSGLVIANDNDAKRCHLLIHQSARLPSPALMVTNMDASNYPNMKIPSSHRPGKLDNLLFDRILCDVPCSGDGTIRKNVGIWKKWSPGNGNGLHVLQLHILQRAMKLLKEDGRIVYSTCSLNPVENEAVVAAALKSNSDFYLVDVSSSFPDLKRQPGLTNWKPSDRRSAAFYATYEDYLKANPLNEKGSVKMSPSQWPPADVESLDLPRCMRIYPHFQDTGGFFVAVLQRRSREQTQNKKRAVQDGLDLPESKKPKLDEPDVAQPSDAASEPMKESTPDTTGPRAAEENAEPPEEERSSFAENPYTFLPSSDPIVQQCIQRLRLSAEFPSSNILTRNPEGEPARSLYIANDIVKAIITHNDYTRIRLHIAGTKVFTKHEGGKAIDAQFRIVDDGLPVVMPFVNPATIVSTDMQSLRVLLASYFPLISTFPDSFQEKIKDQSTGNQIVRIPANSEGSKLTHDLLLPLWKSNSSVSLMIDKKAKSALSIRMFGEDITVAAQAKKGSQAVKDQVAPEEKEAPITGNESEREDEREAEQMEE